MAELFPGLVSAVKGFEGWQPRASWDYKQHTNGWGTRAAYPGEVVDQATGEQRLTGELGKASGLVGAFAPNLDAGTHSALTSLTYNAGNGWMNSGLGKAVQSGDMDAIRSHLLQYNKAGGATLPGLVDRRRAEAGWIGKPDALGAPPAPAYGPEGLNEAGPNGPQPLSLLNLKQPEPSQSMMALGGPKPEGAPVADPNDDPRLQNRGGMNPLVMMGLGLLGSGMEGKGYAAGLLGGANAAQGFDSNRIQELNSERGWAIKQRELQLQQQQDALVRTIGSDPAFAKIAGPDVSSMIGKLPAPQAAALVQTIIAQKQQKEAELAMMASKMKLADEAYGGGQPQPSMPPQQRAPIPQIQPPQPPPAVGAGRFAAPQLGGQPPIPQQPPPQPQAGGQMDPRRIAVLEAAGILPPGAGKVITEDPNYQIQQRTIAAQRMGLQPGTPAHQQYVLTGKFPDVQRSYPAIQKADEAVTQLDNSLDTAHTAKDLNPKAYSSEDWFPGPRTTVGGWFGSEHASDTQNYQAAAKLLSQEIAKANSGGRVNAFEQKLMADLQGGLGQTKAARGQILDRAIKHLETTRALKARQAEELRNGTYYNPPSAAPAAPAAAPLEADGWKVERQ